jgi:hypothetical protein
LRAHAPIFAARDSDSDQCSGMFGSPAEFSPVPDVVHVPPFGTPAL